MGPRTGLRLSTKVLTEDEVVKIRQACVGLPTPFSQIMVALTLLNMIAWLSLSYIW